MLAYFLIKKCIINELLYNSVTQVGAGFKHLVDGGRKVICPNMVWAINIVKTIIFASATWNIGLPQWYFPPCKTLSTVLEWPPMTRHWGNCEKTLNRTSRIQEKKNWVNSEDHCLQADLGSPSMWMAQAAKKANRLSYNNNPMYPLGSGSIYDDLRCLHNIIKQSKCFHSICRST